MINLPDQVARRRHTERQLATLGLAAEFVEAVESKHASRLSPTTARGPSLTAAERACSLSHLSVYRRILEEDIPAACILEDDCAIGPGLPRILDALERRTARWDLVLLGHHSTRHGPAEGAETCYAGTPLPGGFRMARVAEFPMGAYAYVLSRSGARKLLSFASPLRMPADWLTGHSPRARVRLYGVRPPCVTPDPGVASSTTIPSRGGYPPAGRVPAARFRRRAGALLLLLRKLGLRPYSYAKRV